MLYAKYDRNLFKILTLQ